MNDFPQLIDHHQLRVVLGICHDTLLTPQYRKKFMISGRVCQSENHSAAFGRSHCKLKIEKFRYGRTP
jgi:hypothetical protein